MFDFHDLRPLRDIAGEAVSCPVHDCITTVPVQRRRFRRLLEYYCPVHRLFIGRTTFEYEHDADNLLQHSLADQNLLAAVRAFKRESRMARERSEDAVTWNVVRHLEASGRLAFWLTTLTRGPITEPVVHYWSFDALGRSTLAPLAEARKEFGELEGRGSEPDLIIATEDTHIWVEAKLASSNDTVPTDVDGAEARYTTGGAGWYGSSVASPFRAVAVDRRRYELLRLWLLGSWAASRHGKRFLLVNLVRQGREEDVPSFAREHFKETRDRRVRRETWESLFRMIESTPPHSAADVALLNYMRGRSLGYDSRGRLMRTFSLPRDSGTLRSIQS